jgi:DNA-binding NarL/FixJ family response regulator
MGAGVRESRRKKRVFVVEDHPLVRERLTELIQQERDLMVCGDADDHAPALAAVAATKPDLVLVDLTLKNSHGLDLIKDLHAQYPALLMLVVSMHDESLYAERAIHAGARGYVNKHQPSKDILTAIRTVLGGKSFFSDQVFSRLAAKLVESPRRRSLLAMEALTDRELRVFELLGQGHRTRQIAQALQLEIPTVETYRARIKEKLQLKDAHDLLQHAIRWAQSGGL